MILIGMNLVTMLLGTGTLANAVYIIVGVATVLELITHKGHCSTCSGS